MNIHFEKDLPLVDDLKSLFLDDTPMLDVRAAVEFEQGAFTHSSNTPLMNDEERHEIGVRYKEQGQDEAIKLGAELITPDIRAERVSAWQDFITQHPEGVLYCFRGGMRSKISQQWIYEQTGVKYPRVQGGYKAMRRFLIDNTQRLIEQSDFTILSGITGSGKTRILKTIPQAIDLEGLANHRGSAFGPTATPQPTQINFENTLAVQQLKHEAQGFQNIVLEDEGKNIGSVHLPIELYQKMADSPIVLLELPAEERVQISLQEYAVEMLQDFNEQYGEDQGFVHYRNAILTNLDKIKKRLGGERHARLRELAEKALLEHENTGSTKPHIEWVSVLLSEYYDPMYQYQIGKKQDRIVFKGNKQEVEEYLAEKLA